MNPLRPFDLDKLNFEAVRLSRRRKLLLLSLPLTVVIFAFCVKFLSIPILSSTAKNHYKKTRYQTSGQLIAPLYIFNVIEKYKLSFNHGNIALKQGQYQVAETYYREALKSVPQEYECAVRINLALSIEAQADALSAKKAYDEAIVMYDNMKAVLYDGEKSCGVQFNDISDTQDSQASQDNQATDQSDNSGQQEVNNSKDAKTLMESAVDKSNETKRQRNGDQTNTGSNSANETSSSDEQLTKEKLDKLEQISRDGQKARIRNTQNRQSLQDYSKYDYSSRTKRW